MIICPEKHIDLEQYLSVKKTFSAGKRGNFQRWKNCLNYLGIVTYEKSNRNVNCSFYFDSKIKIYIFSQKKETIYYISRWRPPRHLNFLYPCELTYLLCRHSRKSYPVSRQDLLIPQVISIHNVCCGVFLCLATCVMISSLQT